MPRSPSRDLADRYIGNRDYFQQPDGIRRAKHWLALAALAVTVGWFLVDRLMPATAAYSHTHGPLADPHAALDKNCEACHQGYGLKDFGPAAVFHTRERWHKLTCEKCHSGPAHHALMTAAGHEYDKDCSNCHHDHQGRTNSLTRIDDDHCTRCHADLPKNTEGGSPKYEAKITAFAKDHPEFKVLKDGGKPPGGRAIKFSHAVHMTPGITYSKDARGAWTLDRIADPAARHRYRKDKQTDKDAVQLECASCHRLDSGTGTAEFDRLRDLALGQPRSALLPPRAGGAYYLPVNYETDCKACHATDVPPATVGADPDRTLLEGFTVRHRLQGNELRAAIAEQSARGLLAGGKKLTFTLGPGGRLDDRNRPEAARFNKAVDDRVQAALGQLFRPPDAPARKDGGDGYPHTDSGTGCLKCHTADGADRVKAVPNRTVWFEHAKFSHVAHRGVRCADCHPGTEAKFKENGTDVDWTDREPVLISGVDSCKQCHAPAGTTVKKADGTSFVGGGVRSECAECHNYHNGDHWLQGRGSRDRDPKAPLSVEEFFRGKKKD